jgi:hypothetical protein
VLSCDHGATKGVACEARLPDLCRDACRTPERELERFVVLEELIDENLLENLAMHRTMAADLLYARLVLRAIRVKRRSGGKRAIFC